MVLSQGRFDTSAGAIYRGVEGTAITYDVASQRKSATYTTALPGQRWAYVGNGDGDQYEMPWDGGENGRWVLRAEGGSGDRREDYSYTADGQLAAVAKADGWCDPGPQPSPWEYPAAPVWHAPPATGGTLTTIGRDALGRITHYVEQGGYDGSFERRGSVAGAGIAYDMAGRELSETSITIRRDTAGGNFQTYTTNLTNTYTGGLLTRQQQQNLKNNNDSAAADTDQTYTNSWWDGAIQTGISYDNDTSASNTLWTTSYTLDGSGHVTVAAIRDGQWRDVKFATDQAGMVIDRTEEKISGHNTTTAGSPRSLHYLFGGMQMGTASNNDGMRALPRFVR